MDPTDADPPAPTAAPFDAAAFEAMRARLVRLARRRTESRADAEDVVQDAWLRLHETDAASIGEPGAWLATVVARLCIDRLRHAGVERRHAAEVLDGTSPQASHAASAESLVIEARSVRDALAEALRRLSALEAAAWMLREVLDADYAALAALLGRSEAACRQLVHRARERLRRASDAPAPSAERLDRCLNAIRSADRRALVAALFASREAVVARGDRGGPIRCVRVATGDTAVLLGDVVLAVIALEEPGWVAVHDDAMG